MNEVDQLDAIFGALSHATRRAILQHLAQKEATVNELAEPFAMSLPAISRHIKVLEAAGLISRGRNAQFRPCKINAAAFEKVAAWTEAYRPIWEHRFDTMHDVIRQIRETDDGTGK
ncbi:MAG: metalloregulator ArsR/SmtB family transcription factor [Pseudomonadota bacterium]